MIKLGAAAFAIAAFLTWLHLDFAYSFGGAAFIGFSVVALATAGVISGVWFLRRRSTRARGVAILCLGTASLWWLMAVPLSRRQIARSREAGDRIVAALAAYRAREGRVPDRLSSLVPRDLDHLPDTALGLIRTVPFLYDPGAQGGFSLSFPAPGWITCARQANDNWVCDD